jgi:hypothetical protein
MDKHISILTKQHMETKFVKVSAVVGPSHMHSPG